MCRQNSQRQGSSSCHAQLASDIRDSVMYFSDSDVPVTHNTAAGLELAIKQGTVFTCMQAGKHLHCCHSVLCISSLGCVRLVHTRIHCFRLVVPAHPSTYLPGPLPVQAPPSLTLCSSNNHIFRSQQICC